MLYTNINNINTFCSFIKALNKSIICKHIKKSYRNGNVELKNSNIVIC